MAGNLSCFWFEATKDDHRLPTGLSLDLLNGQLHGGRKVVDGAIG